MKTYLSRFLPHVLALLGFVLVALVFFYPVLQNKEIFQSDIVQYIGMAKELKDFRAENNEDTYWTNSAFGGMPTYTLGAHYPHNYIKKVDTALRFLPRPADYLFLYFLGFYILMMVLNVDPLKAFFGSLLFGFSTYLIIILEVGHNAKAHAIAYMPMVIAGIILVFNKRFTLGFILTTLATALQIHANHFQMTYYLLFLVLILVGYYTFVFIKQKDFKALGLVMGIFALSASLAIGLNATNLMATKEYADYSTRGKSIVTIDSSGKEVTQKSGMSYDYITEYSYGKAESFNLIAPRLFGGSNNEKLGEGSHIYEFLTGLGAGPADALEFAESMPTYWGDQPLVAAPAYLGVVVFFLALLGFFSYQKPLKWVFVAAAVFTLLLSWGKNFPLLTNFFIDHVPLYNKFRAVSSIQVIVELCLPILAILGLHSFVQQTKEVQLKSIKWASGIGLGLIALLFFMQGGYSFQGSVDDILRENFEGAYGVEFANNMLEALVKDRQAMYQADLFRSLGLMLASLLLLFGFYKNFLKEIYLVLAIGVLAVLDLVTINKNYVNKESFVATSVMSQPFDLRPADKAILEDKSHYRVFEPQVGMNGGSTSYFHKHLGGYSAVKPQKMQLLYDFHIAKSNLEVLNMLNMKYYITKKPQGQVMYNENIEANGNAWFVEDFLTVNNENEAIMALGGNFKSKNQAVIKAQDFEQLQNKSLTADSTAQIKLISYQPNKLVYEAKNSQGGFAVFSEIYYPKGWKATINDKAVDILNVNFVLRGLEIPAGNHQIVFSFDPEVVKTGSKISLAISILTLFLFGFVVYRNRQKLAP